MHTERKFYGRLHRTTDSTEMKRSGIEGVAGGRYGDDTMLETAWESRWLPGTLKKEPGKRR